VCAQVFQFRKLEQKMTLLSALEDFLDTTLAAVPGLLSKLEYLSRLRGPAGYAHWGMARVHGERAAQDALAEAHGLVISEILRTPLNRLMEDAEASSMAREQNASVYLDALCRQPAVLLPAEVGGGSTRHFSSVLHALSALARNQQHATRPSA
jgi:hypothetical protein